MTASAKANLGSSFSGPRVAASAWGDPLRSTTYSGLPRIIFARLQQASRLTGAHDLRPNLFRSLVWGRFSLRQAVSTRLQRKAIGHWRYLWKNIERMSSQMASSPIYRDADIAFQFGVGGIPPRDVPLIAHIEYPISYVLGHPLFARNYGFGGMEEAARTESVEGERRFSNACRLVLTNTPWTAKLHSENGVDPDRLRIVTPPGNFARDGTVERDGAAKKVLFVGRNWEVKGGDQLVDAFKIVRDTVRGATLTIVGCTPPRGVASLPGVRVLGVLDMSRPSGRETLAQEYRSATVFCMPSRIESTGMVFIEAASYGLPVIMRRIVQTEDLYPDHLFPKVADDDPIALANLICRDLEFDQTVRQRAEEARSFVHDRFGLDQFHQRIDAILEEVVSSPSA